MNNYLYIQLNKKLHVCIFNSFDIYNFITIYSPNQNNLNIWYLNKVCLFFYLAIIKYNF